MLRFLVMERVLILGGGGQTAELFNPTTGSFSPTGNLTVPRLAPSVTLLTDGRVLVAGGSSSNGTTDSTEIYDPTSGIFTAATSMNEPRQQQTATLLSDGQVYSLLVASMVLLIQCRLNSFPHLIQRRRLSQMYLSINRYCRDRTTRW